MLELDELLQPYVSANYARFTNAERATLERFLSLPDPVLLDWILGHSKPVSKSMAKLAGEIRKFCSSRESDDVSEKTFTV